MERISVLMDGELENKEAIGEFERLRGEPALRDTWGVYHLIGDALRGDSRVTAGFTGRFGERLDQEPVVLAPRHRPSLRAIGRTALPIAASIFGAAVAAWLVIYDNPFESRSTATTQQSRPSIAQKQSSTPQEVAQVAAAPASAAVNEYLLAHQQFSPSTAMQGVASYVRTVSVQESDLR